MAKKLPFIYGAKVSLNPNTRDDVIIPIQAGGFMISDLATVSTGAFEVLKLTTSDKDQDFKRGKPADGKLLFGKAGKPLYLPRAWRVKADNQIIMEVLDRSGSGNVIYFAFAGTKTVPGDEHGPAQREDPNMLTGFILLTSGASGVIELYVKKNDFALLGLIQRATGFFEAGPITDDATDKELSNIILHGDTLFGTVEDPRYLPGRRIYEANTTITIPITNLTTSDNYIYLGFLGVDLVGKK